MGKVTQFRQDAMVGLATGNREGKPAERKQEVLTPQCIIDVCNKLWGRIEFDPCPHPDARTGAVSEAPNNLSGMRVTWSNKTYINPPYKDLKDWLEYGQKQVGEQIWLVPVRTHRKWWRHWRDSWLDAHVELDPLKFVGYKQVFPAPLLLGYRGTNALDFMAITKSLGSPYLSRCYLTHK